MEKSVNTIFDFLSFLIELKYRISGLSGQTDIWKNQYRYPVSSLLSSTTKLCFQIQLIFYIFFLPVFSGPPTTSWLRGSRDSPTTKKKFINRQYTAWYLCLIYCTLYSVHCTILLQKYVPLFNKVGVICRYFCILKKKFVL